MKNARIKKGALVGQDFSFFYFKDDEIVFDVHPFNETTRKLVAYGYGLLNRGPEAYGNGALFVKVQDLITMDSTEPSVYNVLSKSKDEIERRFLLRCLPTFTNEDLMQPVMDIIQYYIMRTKQESIRVRCIDNRKFILTHKEGKGIKRKELETDVNYDTFEILKKAALGYTHKDRYVYAPHTNSLIWEIDDFKEMHRDVVIAEVELTDPDYPVVIPALINQVLVAEVTNDHRFSNMFFSGMDRQKVIELLKEYGVDLK